MLDVTPSIRILIVPGGVEGEITISPFTGSTVTVGLNVDSEAPLSSVALYVNVPAGAAMSGLSQDFDT